MWMWITARVQAIETYRYRPTSDAKATYQEFIGQTISQAPRSPPRVIILGTTILDDAGYVVMVDVH